MDKFIYGKYEYNCFKVDPSPENGFNFPFTILIPDNINNNPELIYAWTLPMGGRHNNLDKEPTYEEILETAKNDVNSIDPVMLYLFKKGNPMIVPVIPKIGRFRSNFLGSDIFENDFSKQEDMWYKKHLDGYKNLPDQIKNIINYSVKLLKENNINVPDKVIMTGYSEGSKGTSHFALLHPEVIKSIIVGGTAGLMPVPLKEFEGYTLNYPIGINDVAYFDMDSYKQIKFFYYMGENDLSDPGIPNFEDYHYIDEEGNDKVLVDECGNLTPRLDENGNASFILDENGNYTSKFNLFTDEEVNILNKIYGTKCIDRFKKQEKVFNELGLNNECHLYPGNHRTIFNNDSIDLLKKDIDIFLEK